MQIDDWHLKEIISRLPDDLKPAMYAISDELVKLKTGKTGTAFNLIRKSKEYTISKYSEEMWENMESVADLVSDQTVTRRATVDAFRWCYKK